MATVGNIGATVVANAITRLASALNWIKRGVNCYEDADGNMVPKTNREISVLLYKEENPGPMGGGLYPKEIGLVVMVGIRYEQNMIGRLNAAIEKESVGLDDRARAVYNLLVMNLCGILQVPLLPLEGPTKAAIIDNDDNVPVIGSYMMFRGEWWGTLDEALGLNIENDSSSAIAAGIMRIGS